MTRTELDFAGLPVWLLVLAALGLGTAIVLGYRRDRCLVPPWVGRTLTILRACAAILLLALFLEVSLRRIQVQKEPGELLLILDGSRSMALKDAHRPAWQKMREAAALGLIDRSLRETAPEKALAALDDPIRGRIPEAAWEGIRSWAASRGIPAGEMEGAEKGIRDLQAALTAPEPEPKPEPTVAQDPAAKSAVEAGPQRLEALRASLEGLQRRLDEGLAAALPDAARAALQSLDGLGRLDLARAVLEGGAHDSAAPLAALPADSPLGRLAGRLRISTVMLHAGPQELPRDPSGRILPAPPDGAWTDLGQPVLDEAVRRDRQALAAVLLVSDGRHNRGARPEEILRSLGALGVPLFALVTGPDDAPRNVRIARIDGAGKYFAGDEVRLDVAIESSGMGALSFPLQISEDGKVLGEASAELPAADGITHVPLSFAVPEGGPSGPRRFTVSFPEQPGEVAAADDSRDIRVEVLAGKARVLLLDGGPRWEYRYLRSALGRDANVKLDAFLVTRPPDRRLPEGFPREREALFSHDVLMVGDVEPSVFSREDLVAVRDFVTARGGTLVLLAGPRAMPCGWAGTPLEDLIPVRLRRPAPPGSEGAAIARAGFRLSLAPEGERSAITRLLPGRDANRELWPILPAMDWLAPTLGGKPQAEALALVPQELADRAAGERSPAALSAPAAGGEASPAASGVVASAGSEARRAVLLTMPFGAGRVLYCGVDGTWRWRYLYGDQHFARFWGQLVRWAASERLPVGDGTVRLGTDQGRYEAPARVVITALVVSAVGKPLDDVLVDAVVRHGAPGRIERVRLAPIPRSGGLYRGTMGIGDGEIVDGTGGALAGEYQVSLDIPAIPGYAERSDRASLSFSVEEAPSREDLDLTRDLPLLQTMARRAGPGGRALPVDRAWELPDLIPGKTVEREESTATEQWILAAPLLILFAALAAAEWILRKRYDLA